uniref:Deoxyribonuclease-2-alpha n=1 Tax=Periophthalmus magnuspinnatus TaxID=409849 RepID=A0A3B4A7W9_9GOBI
MTNVLVCGRFYVYKLPRAVGGRSEEEGLEYLLLEKGSEAWAKGSVNINHTNGAVGRTVGQLYTCCTAHPPPPLSPGVVVLDKEQGFWLVHSTPHFPPPQQAGNYSYPDTGLTNGQSFLCVTYPLERFHTIGEQLHINQPHVYDCHVPEALASLVPSLSTLSPPPLTPVSNRSVVLNSSEGTAFISFAKGAAFNNDLYHSWVARELHCPLLVQFWVRSTGVLPSDCSEGVTVLNIQLLSPGPSPSFNNTVDHSKWAVSPEGAQAGGGWVCVGDINRNHAEERRGGGTVCLQDPLVWKAYRSAALQCQDCEGRTTTC